MAKAKPKEASTALIVALVFFVLTTIAFGVMWYLSYSEVDAKVAEAKKKEDEKKPLRDEKREADLKYRTLKVYMGIDEGDDKATIDAERNQGSTVAG